MLLVSVLLARNGRVPVSFPVQSVLAFFFFFKKSHYIKVGNSPTRVSASSPGSKKIFLVLSFSFVLGKNKKSKQIY